MCTEELLWVTKTGLHPSVILIFKISLYNVNINHFNIALQDLQWIQTWHCQYSGRGPETKLLTVIIDFTAHNFDVLS